MVFILNNMQAHHTAKAMMELNNVNGLVRVKFTLAPGARFINVAESKDGTVIVWIGMPRGYRSGDPKEIYDSQSRFFHAYKVEQ